MVFSSEHRLSVNLYTPIEFLLDIIFMQQNFANVSKSSVE